MSVECVVCFETDATIDNTYKNSFVSLPCPGTIDTEAKHMVCFPCFITLMKLNGNCPMCRHHFIPAAPDKYMEVTRKFPHWRDFVRQYNETLIIFASEYNNVQTLITSIYKDQFKRALNMIINIDGTDTEISFLMIKRKINDLLIHFHENECDINNIESPSKIIDLIYLVKVITTSVDDYQLNFQNMIKSLVSPRDH